MTEKSKSIAGSGNSASIEQIVGQGLLSHGGTAHKNDVKDELELAVGDLNSSGLLSKGMLDELNANINMAKPSGRFSSQPPNKGDQESTEQAISSELDLKPVKLTAEPPVGRKGDFDTVETFGQHK